MVGEEGRRWGTVLKASVGVEPSQPPSTGWKFYSGNTKEWVVSTTITCAIFVNSPPCCLTVTLSGKALEAHRKCEGQYKSTGLVSMGRPVIFI